MPCPQLGQETQNRLVSGRRRDEGNPSPNAGRGDAGAGREPISFMEQDAASPSVLAVFWVWGHGGEQGNAVPEFGSAALAPAATCRTRSVAATRPGPHGSRTSEAPAKGAARNAREDGARGATAPPALATGQTQRHLSVFQLPPPPTPARSYIPGDLGGANRIGPAHSRPK